ncbi:RNA polymerase factor sigma-54 [Leptolyngbya sp. 15MV]|nr:RNA polymerase factor sigma-54 [Leptolyngbya sp. 15MV]
MRDQDHRHVALGAQQVHPVQEAALDVRLLVLLRSYADVQDALDTLYEQPHDFQTVVLDSLDWLEPLPGGPDRGFDDGPGPARAADSGERDAKMDAMASTPSRAVPLADQLLDQWHLAEVDPQVREAGDLLIQFIEEDGYLRTPLETIASRAPEGRRPSVELLERALTALQRSLEPAGIGARDRRECLLLQIDAQRLAAPVREPALEHARLLIEGYLDDLAQNRIPRIVERTGLSVEEVAAAKARMRGLSLAPGRGLVSESPASIRPDVIVEYDEEGDRYVAYLAESRWASLQVNREYALMARDRTVPEKDREFIRKNLSNAQWLIEAVAQRRSTLLRVVERVIQHQREVLDFGWQALKPLPMTQVAEELGMHVATVSRAVSEKHLLTPRGVIPLRRLFTGGLATEGGGEVSADAVKAALEELIAQENKSAPLSDDALADALKKRGIEIARRTVAKYRDQLGIQPARLRKAF